MFGRKVFSTKALTVTLGLAVLSAPALALETSANGNTDLNKLNALSTVTLARAIGINAIISAESNARSTSDANIQTNISTVYSNAQGLAPTLAALPGMINSLRACASNNTCTKSNPATKPPVFAIRHFTVNAGGTGCWLGCYEKYQDYNTNLNASTWQFCAVTGGLDSEDKNHGVEKRSNIWWVWMEKSDIRKDTESGGVKVTCFSVTRAT